MKRSGTVLCISALLTLAASGPLLAADTAAGDELAEVVVTAEFRTVDVQKTAINLTVVTQVDMLKRGIVDTRTMIDSVPGLMMTNANPNNYVGLYGTGSGAGNQWADASMGFNYGGVPLARQTSAAASMFDLERVEVLKGPQGTLYGRNATTGAINLVIARPTAEYGGGAALTVGNYATLNTQAHLNLPFSDKVMTRFAFQNTHHDGYYTNGFDDANNYSFRASVLFKPNDNVSLLVWGDTFKNRAKGPTTTMRYYYSDTQEWINPKNPWDAFLVAGSCPDIYKCPSFLQSSAGGANANPGLSALAPPAPGSIANGTGLGNGFLDTSATGLANYSVWAGPDSKSNSGQDVYAAQLDWQTSAGVLTALAARVNSKVDYISYSNGLRFGNLSDAYQNSLEVRFANNATGKLKWLVGGFYYKESQNAFQWNMQNNGYALLSTPNLNDTNNALFADATFSATDRFRVSAGVRHTNETKTQDGYVIINGVPLSNFAVYAPLGINCFPANVNGKVNFAGFNMPSNFCTIPNGGKYKDSNTSGKLGFEFDIASDVMAYLTAKQGFRAGGLTAGTETSYKPEKLMAYELGLRSRFMGGRLQANVSAFRWNYKDQQFSILQPYIVAGVKPAGVQTSYPYNVDGYINGAEIDLQARVLSNDRAHIDALWTKGKFDSIPTVINSTGVQAALVNPDRHNLPQWTINFGYDHRIPLADGANISMGFDGHNESSVFLQQVAPAALVPGMLRGGYTKFDLNLGYTAPNDKWSLTGYMLNVTNEAVVGPGSSGQVANATFFKSAFNTANARSATLDPPRTYGVRFNANF